MKLKIRKDIKISYIYLLKWILLALLAGAVGSLTVHSFFFLLSNITKFFLSYPVPPPAYAVFGAVVSGGLIYRLQPNASGEGIPSYIQGLRDYGGELSPSVTLFKYFAGLATLSTFGNGGIVGPVGRVSAGIMSLIAGRLQKLGLNRDDIHTAAICGMAATVGAVFHTPIGGGIFAVEIIQRRKLGYKDLFPAILSSSTAVFLARTFHVRSFYRIQVPGDIMDVRMIGWLAGLSVLLGLAGALYAQLYVYVSKLIKREKGKTLVKVVSGSLVASSIAWLINPELLGTSTRFIQSIITGDMAVLSGRLPGIIPIGWVLLIMLIGKAVCNCITVGSGMSAGFTGPAAIIGMLLGGSVAFFLHLDQTSPTFFAFIAAGFSGMLASSMNIPLASSVMAIEIFGLEYSIPAALAAIIGFQINRHMTIYDFAKAGSGKGQQ